MKFENRGFSRHSEEAIVRKLEKQYAQEWLTNLPLDIVEGPLPTAPTP